ncbi:MAG: nitrous oxide reductase accessory protein NosL [Deferrisomatales bacterium]
MRRWRRGAAALMVLVSVSCWASGPSGAPADPGPRDRCPVCGMFVAGFANWVATIVFADGTQAFFDGPKDMLTFYFDPGKYDPKRDRSDVEALFVTEYYSTRRVPVEAVYFVLGSDVLGPMGRELVPVSGRKRAETFLRDHQGTRMLRFSELSAEILSDLR